MGDISHSARAGDSRQSSGSGNAESRQKGDNAEEARRLDAKIRLAVERLTRGLETRTRSPEELARERWAKVPRRTEPEMREPLEAELSRYSTLRHGWDGYSAKPASPDSLRDARKFLPMRPAGVPLPYPALDTEGEVELCWNSGDLSVAVMFEGDRKFHFVVLRHSGGRKNGRAGADDCPVDSGWPEALAGPLREL